VFQPFFGQVVDSFLKKKITVQGFKDVSIFIPITGVIVSYNALITKTFYFHNLQETQYH
jgi:hypothetical protein